MLLLKKKCFQGMQSMVCCTRQSLPSTTDSLPSLVVVQWPMASNNTHGPLTKSTWWSCWPPKIARGSLYKIQTAQNSGVWWVFILKLGRAKVVISTKTIYTCIWCLFTTHYCTEHILLPWKRLCIYRFHGNTDKQSSLLYHWQTSMV